MKPAEDDAVNIVVQDRLVVVVSDSYPSAFDARTGCARWESDTEIDDDGSGTARVGPTTIDYWSEDYPEGVVLSRANGKVLHPLNRPNPGPLDAAATNVRRLGGWVVHNGDTDEAVRITSPDGRRWIRDVVADFDPSPVVSDGTWLYWGSADGLVAGLDTTTQDISTAMANLRMRPA